MKLIAIAVLTACALWTDPAQSFDLHTHVAMTAKAVEKSALGVNPASSAVISRLGLTSPDAVLGRRYIGFALPQKYGFATSYEGDVFRRVRDGNPGSTLTIPDDFSITGWIMRGAVREDDELKGSASFVSQLQRHPIELDAGATGHAGRIRRNN